MAKTQYQDVDDYIATQPKEARPVLERVRSAIRRAVPGADEGISYQIPSYKLGGMAVIHFAGWKEHFSVYPATDGVAEAFADELAPYEISKGTIRFPMSAPVPAKLIEKIAKYRAAITRDRLDAKASAKKPAAMTATKKSAATATKATTATKRATGSRRASA